MADSWRQALRILRSNGPGFFVRFLGSRVATTVALWRRLRDLPPTEDFGEMIDLMVDRPLGAGQPVFAMQRKSEIAAFLARMTALRPRRAQIVVEIGTASGGTLFLLSRAAAPDALLVSLDLPGGSFGGGYQAWRKPLYRSFAHAGQRIVLLRVAHHITATVEPQQRGPGLADADRPVQPHTDTGAEDEHLDVAATTALYRRRQRADQSQRPRAEQGPWGQAGDSAKVGVKIGARHRSSIANAKRPHVPGSAVDGENIRVSE